MPAGSACANYKATLFNIDDSIVNDKYHMGLTVAAGVTYSRVV